MPEQPDYRRVVDDIRARIADGRLKPGEQLPTRLELAEQYGVSLSTVARALLLLTETGDVIGRQGKGVFVPAERR